MTRFEVGQRYQASVGTRTIQAVTNFAIGDEVIQIIAFTVNDENRVQQRVGDRVTGWTLIADPGSEVSVTLSSGAVATVDGGSARVQRSARDEGLKIPLTPEDRQSLIDALTTTTPGA